ncbi:MAG TPA: hypothetical protein VGP43_02450 [Chitinophagaceae bacterium]|nr:hypothetical protein [Chitinophagaceae bacterium]
MEEKEEKEENNSADFDEIKKQLDQFTERVLKMFIDKQKEDEKLHAKILLKNKKGSVT